MNTAATGRTDAAADPAGAQAPPGGGAEADARTVVCAEELGVRIDGRALVDGLSFRLRAGTVTALIGASGSGKTTAGLALLGEYPEGAEVQGEVRWTDGEADGAAPFAGRGRGAVGYVPQHPSAVLNPARRAGALLREIAWQQVRALCLPVRERRGAVRARVLRALEAAQLTEGEELLRRYPHQLSGGQQQRVVLAQALLLGARVVVADEPTTGQDALTKQRIVTELAALAAEGIAVLLLSHDLGIVRRLAHEVVVMKEGRAVESGPVDQIWSEPEHEWTREMLVAQPDGALPVPGRDRPGALSLHVRAARHRDRERGTVQALQEAGLTATAGECVAVVGRSGSGKTTLARCVAGLHRDWDGEVTLPAGGTAGTAPLPHSLRARSRRQLAAVQYVFQDARAAFDEHRPVLSQVARTAVRLRGVAPDAALEEARTVLGRVGLDEGTTARLPGRLSGGELQRAALARALLAHPRVLVCDEITSGLDVVTRRAVTGLLDGLLRERDDLSLVLITHDLPTAAALARRIVVLDGGTVAEQGPAEQLLTAPEHPFTRSLLRASRYDAPSHRGPA